MLSVEHIANVLAAANVGEIGKTLFAHRMPAEVTKGVLVLAPLAGDEIDHELPGWRRGRFQIIARARTPLEATMLALQATLALTWHKTRILPEAPPFPAVEVRYLRPMHDPAVYPKSEGNLVEASVNFETAHID